MESYIPTTAFINVYQNIDLETPKGIINISDADPEIIPILRILNENGIKTFESCQGGIEHAFGKPTIRFHGNYDTAMKVMNLCNQHNFSINYFRKYYVYESPYENIYEFKGPRWEVIFKKNQKRFSSIDYKNMIKKGFKKNKLKQIIFLFNLHNFKIISYGSIDVNSRCPSYAIKFSGDEKEQQRALNLLHKNKIKICHIQMYYRIIDKTLKKAELQLDL